MEDPLEENEGDDSYIMQENKVTDNLQSDQLNGNKLKTFEDQYMKGSNTNQNSTPYKDAEKEGLQINNRQETDESYMISNRN